MASRVATSGRARPRASSSRPDAQRRVSSTPGSSGPPRTFSSWALAASSSATTPLAWAVASSRASRSKRSPRSSASGPARRCGAMATARSPAPVSPAAAASSRRESATPRQHRHPGRHPHLTPLRHGGGHLQAPLRRLHGRPGLLGLATRQRGLGPGQLVPNPRRPDQHPGRDPPPLPSRALRRRRIELGRRRRPVRPRQPVGLLRRPGRFGRGIGSVASGGGGPDAAGFGGANRARDGVRDPRRWGVWTAARTTPGGRLPSRVGPAVSRVGFGRAFQLLPAGSRFGCNLAFPCPPSRSRPGSGGGGSGSGTLDRATGTSSGGTGPPGGRPGRSGGRGG